MAVFKDAYKCGHEGVITKPSSNYIYMREVNYEFSGLCPECKKKAIQAKIEKDNVNALAINNELNLPTLKGTDKQVTWANTLRLKLIETIREFAAGITEEGGTPAYLIMDRLVCLGIGEEKATKMALDFPKISEDLIQYLIDTKREAKYFIDKRLDREENVIAALYLEMVERKEILS